MKSLFIYEEALEYERFVTIFRSLATEIYQDHGFLVLPYRLRAYSKSIYLPDIAELKLSQWIPMLRKLKHLSVPLGEKPAWMQNLLNMLKGSSFEIEPIDSVHTSLVQSQWEAMKDQFEDYFTELFPRYRRYHFELGVYWTRYGSLVSYSEPRLEHMRARVNICLRDDMGVTEIIEGFISSILLPDMRATLKYSWFQRESIIDFLLQRTKLARLAASYTPTLAATKKSAELEKHYICSINYLKKLGLSRSQGLSLDENRLLLNGELPRSKLSKYEASVLQRLLQTPDEPVNYFELGDLLWKNTPDQFSLWALSRHLFKIRNKLRLSGISPDSIKNIRGQGYMYTRVA